MRRELPGGDATGLTAAPDAQAPGEESPQRQRETILRLHAAAAHEETRKVLLLRAPRLPLLPLRLSGASCGGARRRQHARLSSSCWKLREALRALAHPELGAPTKTMAMMEPMGPLLLLPVDSMKLLLEPPELMELLELAERKGVRLLKKNRGE